MPQSKEAREAFSNKLLAQIRQALEGILSPNKYLVVTVGSVGRKEASGWSDLDYFVVCNSKKEIVDAEKDVPKIEDAIYKIVYKEHAQDGAFGKVSCIEDMISNIGGQDDLNSKITLRILYLLEGDWLFDENRFHQYRDLILAKYIQETISEHQFCRFLLNDLIRYYRTICVDFEHKTIEKGKSWGDRNIKLVFSRKLLYFSGILVTAETWQQTYKVKRQIARELLSLNPIDRLQRICGAKSNPVVEMYESYLERMADPEIRKLIDAATIVKATQSEQFRRLKNDGHHFSLMLGKLLKDTYGAEHPIHNALIV